MTSTQIWILCQGEQRRLAHLGHPKQLLEVNGEPILRRTLRLLRELEAPSPLVICWPNLARELDQHIRALTLDEPGNCILDGMARAAALFREPAPRTIVLLGDVVWSRQALAAVLADQRGLFFAGTTTLNVSQGELFAVSWTDHAEMISLLDTVACRRAKWSQQQGGHLRRLLWWAQNRRNLKMLDNARVRRHEVTWHPDLYLEVTDWTTDIDDEGDVAIIPGLSARCATELG